MTAIPSTSQQGLWVQPGFPAMDAGVRQVNRCVVRGLQFEPGGPVGTINSSQYLLMSKSSDGSDSACGLTLVLVQAPTCCLPLRSQAASARSPPASASSQTRCSTTLTASALR